MYSMERRHNRDIVRWFHYAATFTYFHNVEAPQKYNFFFVTVNKYICATIDVRRSWQQCEPNNIYLGNWIAEVGACLEPLYEWKIIFLLGFVRFASEAKRTRRNKCGNARRCDVIEICTSLRKILFRKLEAHLLTYVKINRLCPLVYNAHQTVLRLTVTKY